MMGPTIVPGVLDLSAFPLCWTLPTVRFCMGNRTKPPSFTLEGYLAAIRFAHASAGGAAVCVAMVVAVAVGYVVLLASPGYLVHHWIAVLVPVTMLASLVGTLFVFPFALRLLRQRFTPHVDMFPDWNEATAELLPMVVPAEDRSLG